MKNIFHYIQKEHFHAGMDIQRTTTDIFLCELKIIHLSLT